MPRNNSYAQGGWHNPQNPHSIDGQVWNANASRPPTFGALPAFSSSPPTYLVSEFANVLNYGELVAGLDCRVIPAGLRSLTSSTDKPAPSGCYFRLTSGTTLVFKIFCDGVTNRMQLPNYDVWWTPVHLGSPWWRINCGMCYLRNRFKVPDDTDFKLRVVVHRPSRAAH